MNKEKIKRIISMVGLALVFWGVAYTTGKQVEIINDIWFTLSWGLLVLVSGFKTLQFMTDYLDDSQTSSSTKNHSQQNKKLISPLLDQVSNSADILSNKQKENTV